MSLRSFVVSKALRENDEILAIHGHGFASCISFIIVRCGVFSVMARCMYTIQHYITFPITTGILPGIGIIIYCIACVRYLDIYLDVIVVAKQGLHVFKWEGIFESKIQTIERSSVQSIQDSQQGLRSTLTNAGDIKIFFQYGEIIFYDIHDPAGVRKNITHYKDKIMAHKQQEQADTKFDRLVDALSDIIAAHYDDETDSTSSDASHNERNERTIGPFRPY